ncbi:hypothetical protein ACWD9K_10015 [Streptomyces sp. 900116325]|uniref:hypothetical protein n=1 Tax=Streptomyces sp. NPDC000133 TaxID=3364535 RepID=UPI0036BE0B7E
MTAYRPPVAPKDIVATPGISRVTFTWTTDHDIDGNIYDFHVYRSETLPVDASTGDSTTDGYGSSTPAPTPHRQAAPRTTT